MRVAVPRWVRNTFQNFVACKIHSMPNIQDSTMTFFFEGEENTLDVEEEMVAAESLAGTEFPTPVPTAESGSNQEPIPHTGLAI
mmetsp:Transcript_14325/g.22608  ORF Transcript_14325/g.22608 Transcript_14325/m.22608 type:complete len:84 (+) Transcript_14325:941-1192(+)